MATVFAERGTESTADEPMYIYMYPNTVDEEQECENAIGTRMKNICDELFDANSIDYYKITIRYDRPDEPDSYTDEFFTEFKDWFYNQSGFGGELGAHLGVADGFEGGRAEAGNDQSGQTSFSTSNVCVAGINTYKEEFSNIAIQEVLHPFLWDDVLYEANLIDDDEHDLGHIYKTFAHPVSPMASGYEGTHTGHGECDNEPGWGENWKASLTSCTKEGVEATADFDT